MNEIDKNLMILREKMKKGFENYEEYVPGWDEIVKPLNEKLSNINDLLEDCKVLEEMMMADQENLEEFENLFELKLKASQEVLKLDDKKEDLAKKEKTPQKEVKKIKEKEENYLVAPISQEEFNTIPKYMIGRFTLESLNEIAQKFDEFLKHKISIYSKAGKSLTRHEKQELDKFRELEEKARKRLSTNTFCVENDIRPLIQEKLKPLFSKSIPCLRHVRRIREERCGPLTFYYP